MDNINERRKAVSSYSIIRLAEDIGFTPVPMGRNGKYYSLKEHDSVVINTENNTFFRNKTRRGGDVVAFCIDLGSELKPRFKSVGYAIGYLEKRMQFDPNVKVDKHDIKERPRQPIVLPEADKDNRRIISYLKKRNISDTIISDFIDKKMIYQEKEHKNVVFVANNKDIPQYVIQKSSKIGSRFMLEDSNNNYDYGYFIDNHSDHLIVTEAVIDAMSIMSLYEHQHLHTNTSFLSLNSVNKDRALYSQLEKHPGIHNVILCLDNDEAGNKATERIMERLDQTFPQVKYISILPEQGKDWNEYIGILKEQDLHPEFENIL